MSTNSDESIDDLAMRYIQAATNTHHGLFPEFEWSEIERINEHVRSRFTTAGDSLILHVYESIVREFAKGHRCGVCGMTEAQSMAANYDCSNEC